ncbi:Pr6Pr family membrane protein [Sandarakinorhabdus rubra]|uniref:Pr6Pr family membrane protein n=1 Tax=Sandarakinorhabdus rubra TaxID=2672568 RepID=UPI0013DBE631|nr:Pr6Pr family membrane protein [Sandarakinorhabdus rubra]
MEEWLQPGPRMAAAVIAVLAGGALLTQFGLDIVERGRDPAGEVAHLAGWFTIWSNTMVALIASHAGLMGRARGPSHPALLAASAAWIVVVGVVYNTLLAHLNHPPTLARQLIDQVFHTVMPLAWPAWWLWGRPAGALRWRHLAAVLPLPLAYCAFSLWVGGQTGRYAYFFIDVARYGWGQVTLNIIGLAAFFVGLMAAAIAWDRRGAPAAAPDAGKAGSAAKG